jgi:N-glycosylase/DNA lyase
MLKTISIRFICSSNNNISRITKMVQNLSTNFSPPLLSLIHPFNPAEVLTYHPFPPPSALAAPGVALQLRSLGFGYRANYIQRTAQMLVKTHVGHALSDPESSEDSEIWLRRLRESTTAEAREELLKFIGVGRKVADCILLMSLDKVSSLFVLTLSFVRINQRHAERSRTGRHPRIPNCR